MKSFRETIADILEKEGLVEKESSEEDLDDDIACDEDGSKRVTEEELEAQRLERQRQLESADGKTFGWLAELTGMDHMRFDPELIDSVYLRIDQLK